LQIQGLLADIVRRYNTGADKKNNANESLSVFIIDFLTLLLFVLENERCQ
jgi:hypothetical protein